MRRVTTILGVGVFVGGCTVANAVDVCDGVAGDEREINVLLTRGDQAPQDLASLPNGRGFAFFTSAESRDGDQLVAGTLFDPAGGPARTCNVADDSEEVVYSDAAPGEERRTAAFAKYALPSGGEDRGLLTWTLVEGDITPDEPGGPIDLGSLSTSIRGRFVEATGCVPFDASSFLIADDAGLGPAAAVRLDVDRFAVVYGSGVLSTGQLRMREVQARLRPGRIEASVGPAVSLLDGAVVPGVSMARLDDDAFVVVVEMAGEDNRSYVRFGTFDEAGRALLPWQTLDSWIGAGGESLDPALALSDGTALVVWGRSDEARAGQYALAAALVDPLTGPLPTPHSPDGRGFLVDPVLSGAQRDPTAVALSGGRFLVAWTADGAAGEGSVVQARLLDPEGDTQFSYRGCARDAFTVHGPLEGPQERPSAAYFPDAGRVVISWADGGDNAADGSGTSVRVASFVEAELLPEASR